MTIESAITFFKNNAYLFLFSSILLLPVKNSFSQADPPDCNNMPDVYSIYNWDQGKHSAMGQVVLYESGTEITSTNSIELEFDIDSWDWDNGTLVWWSGYGYNPCPGQSGSFSCAGATKTGTAYDELVVWFNYTSSGKYTVNGTHNGFSQCEGECGTTVSGGSSSMTVIIHDPDIDNDGTPNSSDPDVDGDGKSNKYDTDDDNDGILDGNDSTPGGPGHHREHGHHIGVVTVRLVVIRMMTIVIRFLMIAILIWMEMGMVM